jgi:hypothetical protein
MYFQEIHIDIFLLSVYSMYLKLPLERPLKLLPILVPLERLLNRLPKLVPLEREEKGEPRRTRGELGLRLLLLGLYNRAPIEGLSVR